MFGLLFVELETDLNIVMVNTVGGSKGAGHSSTVNSTAVKETTVIC